jgi:GRAS domain family
MDSSLNLLELSDTIDGLSPDDFNTEQDASSSTTVHQLEPFLVSANKASKRFPISGVDCKFPEEPHLDKFKTSEEIGGLNSNPALRYLSQLLLEEDTCDKINTYEEELALLATEKTFHDILRQEYYSAPDEPFLHDSPPYQMSSVTDSNFKKANPGGERELVLNCYRRDLCYVKPSLVCDDQTSTLPIQRFTAKQIQKGIDEAKKFLPNISEFFINPASSGTIYGMDCLLRTKNYPSYTDMDQLGGRALKQIATYSDEPIRNEIFDKVLLLHGQKYIEEDTLLRKIMQKEMRDRSQQSKDKDSMYAKEKNKNPIMDEPVDLQSLLLNCAHAISANDHYKANELIYKIKKHSSPNGDWSQRLAHYFADGLQARLAGTANEIYDRISREKVTVIETLNAYRMYLAISPCRRALVYFANQTILNNISKHTQKVHIIIYGNRYGYQWPAFFEHFSKSEGTPPKIRVTIVEVPEPGFRPRWRVDLIGQRLADYAKSFNVPFEYEGIVSKWEDVKVEDLKIADDEVVIVNCIIHSEKLSDEAIGADSPRDIFLNTIRKIKPRVFIHVVFNGSYNSPFFLPRFRAALSFYSSLLEMLDCNMPRDNPERIFIERHFLMAAAVNAIAFEGPGRVERPETYKQWHARKLRAGLELLPVDLMIKNNFKEYVREHYHKDFSIDEDIGWLLVGWKGRILYGLSTWKAKEA